MKEAEKRTQQINTQEQVRTHNKSSADIPGVPKIGAEQQGWWGRPHEEMVRSFQNYVQERMQRSQGEFTPAEVIVAWISLHGHPRNRREADFYSQLSLAWDALAFDHYIPGSREDFRAGDTLYKLYKYAKIEAIKLADPLQIRVLDVLTEAVGIPHQKGQYEIKIPEKLKDYNHWIHSKENEERIANALAERQAKKIKLIPGYIEPKSNI